MTARIVQAARALVNGSERREFAFAVQDERIVAVEEFAQLQARFPQASIERYGPDVALLPGFVNGHSHAYQILLRGWADDLPFARWRSDALYKIVPELTPAQVYWTFRLAFDEMLAAGITTVAEFFYLNGAGNEHASEAIRAAHDAGIRLVFARTWMDAEYAPQAFREPIALAQQRTLALMEAFPDASVCVAPHSLHAASPEMIRAAGEFARAQDCMLHVHLAEAAYEGVQTKERFGASPVELLEQLGALNERTVAIHAIHITSREKDMLASARARVVHNPMTNQYLGDGICDVEGLLARGVQVGLGTDADVKPSIIEEMRSASLLQKIARSDGSALGARTALAMATSGGAQTLNVRAGAFEPGLFADYAVLDLCGAQPWSPLENQLVYRAENASIRETYVGGRRVRTSGDAPPDRALRELRDLIPALHR